MADIVIADTSCLIALDKIDHLFILEELYSVIHITKQISAEYGKTLPDTFKIHNVITLTYLDQVLDPGEASALTLALTFDEPLVIIDEKKGRKIASELNITIVGTLRVLLLAKQKNIIGAIKPLIHLLEGHSFRFSKAIVADLLKLAGE